MVYSVVYPVANYMVIEAPVTIRCYLRTHRSCHRDMLDRGDGLCLSKCTEIRKRR